MQRSPRIIAAAAAVSLAVGLAGCSAGSNNAGDDASSTPEATSMTFVAYGGVTQDVMKQQWLDPFAAKEGVSVVQDSPTDYAKLQQMVQAGRTTWDLVDTEPFFPIQECGKVVQKLHVSIDESKLPKGTVSDCAVPIWGYSLLLVYNTEKYKDHPPTSFADFFDLKKFPGTRLAPSSATAGGLEVGLLADGVSPKKLYPLDMDRSIKKWDELKGKVQFWSTASESQQALESGSADMALVWSGRAAEAEKNGAKITPVWKDNLFSWASATIPVGSKATGLAEKAIENLLEPETQARLAENIAYSPVNSAAKPDLNPIYAKYNVTAPDAVEDQVTQNAEWWAKNQKAAVATWSNWTLG